MKNKTIYWVIAFIVLIIAVVVIKKIQEEPQQPEKVSLWTIQEKSEAVRNFEGSDYEKFVLKQFIYGVESKISSQKFNDAIGTEAFKSSFSKQKGLNIKKYKVKISLIAGKSKKEVQKVLGKPVSSESVNPSGTPCPCDKLIYLNGLVEIVYMYGEADWITINNSQKYVVVGNYSYKSVSKFEDYTYIKVVTD